MTVDVNEHQWLTMDANGGYYGLILSTANEMQKHTQRRILMNRTMYLYLFRLYCNVFVFGRLCAFGALSAFGAATANDSCFVLRPFPPYTSPQQSVSYLIRPVVSSSPLSTVPRFDRL
jgi:hypothetical protein